MQGICSGRRKGGREQRSKGAKEVKEGKKAQEATEAKKAKEAKKAEVADEAKKAKESGSVEKDYLISHSSIFCPSMLPTRMSPRLTGPTPAGVPV